MENVVDIKSKEEPILKKEPPVETVSFKEEVVEKSETLKCKKCAKVFHRKEIYKAHVQLCGVKPEFKCSVCQAPVENENVFRYHLQFYCSKGYQCPLCPCRFKHVQTLQYHIIKLHRQTYRFWERFKAEKGGSAPPGAGYGFNGLRLKFWDKEPVLLKIEKSPEVVTKSNFEETPVIKEEVSDVKTEPNYDNEVKTEPIEPDEKIILNPFKRRKLFNESFNCKTCGKSFDKEFRLKIHYGNTGCGR